MNELNKGLFLTEFYGVKEIPALVDEQGKPTKFAEAASYWGESIPTNQAEVKRLVAKGAALQATQNFSQSQKLSYNAVYGGRQELSLVRPNRIKVPFVKTGSWKHDVYGEVKFTEEDVQQLINNYRSNVTGFVPYLTLGHLDEEPDSTDSHRKRGNLQDIIVENDIAYGIFDVAEDVYEAVKKGEYEYSSGEFNRQFTDKETGNKVGTAVIRVALTNSPFLPFGDSKTQALSNEAENCPESKESYVFLLSVDAQKDNSNKLDQPTNKTAEEADDPAEKAQDMQTNKLSNTENTMTNQVDNQVEETQVEAASEAVEEVNKSEVVAEEEKKEAPAVAAVESTPEVKPEVKEESNPAEKAIANLSSQLNKIESLYKTQLEAANKTINSLSEKVEGLTSQLNSQSEVTQAFSTSMSKAQEQAVVNQLQSNGVQPATIQQFLSFKNAFENAENKNVVKFSQNVDGEVKDMEYNVVEAVAGMLVSAANQAPLIEQQLGVSSGRKPGAFNFNSIIERNKEAANKTHG